MTNNKIPVGLTRGDHEGVHAIIFLRKLAGEEISREAAVINWLKLTHKERIATMLEFERAGGDKARAKQPNMTLAQAMTEFCLEYLPSLQKDGRKLDQTALQEGWDVFFQKLIRERRARENTTWDNPFIDRRRQL